jgi:hypothetical protein
LVTSYNGTALANAKFPRHHLQHAETGRHFLAVAKEYRVGAGTVLGTIRVSGLVAREGSIMHTLVIRRDLLKKASSTEAEASMFAVSAGYEGLMGRWSPRGNSARLSP